MKSVMISIKPKWCELIASGKKTVEVRKTRPKIETPFKCYIYCTQDLADSRTRRKRSEFWIGEPLNNVSKGRYIGNGMVIGEFVCENIAKGNLQTGSCLSMQEIGKYANEKQLYGWCISDLVIYDEPKELSEFAKPCNHNCFAPCPYYQGKEYECEKPIITRPPQSWCYVEELKE